MIIIIILEGYDGLHSNVSRNYGVSANADSQVWQNQWMTNTQCFTAGEIALTWKCPSPLRWVWVPRAVGRNRPRL